MLATSIDDWLAVLREGTAERGMSEWLQHRDDCAQRKNPASEWADARMERGMAVSAPWEGSSHAWAVLLGMCPHPSCSSEPL